MDTTPPPYFQYNYTSSGKIVVTLNGTVYNNCTRDIDCPDFALCYRNVSWSAFPAQCACWTNENLVGRGCREFGWYKSSWYVFAVLAMIISSVSFFGSIVAWAITMRLEGGFRVTIFSSSLNWTYLFVILASAMLFLQQIFEALPYTFSVDYTTGQKTIRSQELSQGITSALIACFFFVSLATLNVSLVWLKVHASYSRKRGGAAGGVGGGGDNEAGLSEFQTMRSAAREESSVASTPIPMSSSTTMRTSMSNNNITNGRKKNNGLRRCMDHVRSCAFPSSPSSGTLHWLGLYTTTLLVYYIVFFVALCYFWVNGQVAVVSWFGAAAILFIAFTYGIAYRRLRSVFSQFETLNSELRWQYGSISFAAGTISINCFAAFSALIAYIATGGGCVSAAIGLEVFLRLEGGLTTLYLSPNRVDEMRTPAGAESYLVVGVFWFLVTLLVFWVFIYLAQTLRMKLAKQRKAIAALREDAVMRARMNVASVTGAGADFGQYSPRLPNDDSNSTPHLSKAVTSGSSSAVRKSYERALEGNLGPVEPHATSASSASSRAIHVVVEGDMKTFGKPFSLNLESESPREMRNNRDDDHETEEEREAGNRGGVEAGGASAVAATFEQQQRERTLALS